ncbi:WbuC family cupin fold metalloprotein [Geotalea toluenoxydans]
MNISVVNDEVLYALDGVVCVNQSYIEGLKLHAAGNPRKRARLCAHPDETNNLHEMLVVLGKANYIRPHLHTGKSESFHVIEGRADVILFDNDGKALKCIELGEPASGLCFYFRLDKILFHTLVIRSDYFVFHETTNGPFIRTDMTFAEWSPKENEIEAGQLFIQNKIYEMGKSA